MVDRANTLIGRAEGVTKSAEDLVLGSSAGMMSGDRFGVGAVSLGYVREVARGGRGTIGLGAMGTVSGVPGSLVRTYGSRAPVGGFLFLRVRPGFGAAGDSMAGMRMP